MNKFAGAVAAIAAAVGLLGASPAFAQKVVSGTSNGLSWTAQNTIIGVTPTAGPTGGDPLYFPSFPQYSGVVGIRMDYADGSAFICSGTLLADRRTVLTAAHCVSDGFGTAGPATTTVYFQPPGGLDPNGTSILFSPGQTRDMVVANIHVHPGYTGEVIDQNDIALLDLGDNAPEWAKGHLIYTDPLGQDVFNVAGYGGRSTIGGNFGTDSATGRLRQGDNRYDWRFGDPAFDGFWTDIIGGENFFGTAEIDYSYVSDFDNGLAANDTACRIANAGIIPNPADIAQFCNTGLGAREVGVAGGDSGGPNFIGDLISGVNSYGLSFGTGFGDFRPGLNSSFGEFSGYVPTFIHYDWIRANSGLPEPSSLALGLLAVAGAAGVSRRRRQSQA